MPREVIHLQVGQCGNQIGTKFWETIAQEHGLAPDGTYQGTDPVQLEKIDVYYHETNHASFVPRNLLIDTENSVLNHITARTYGKMFRPENFLANTEGAANCFMVGYYHQDSTDLCGRVMDTLRLEVERTDCLQGFTFSHSSSGGTGSGLCMQIFKEIIDDKLLLPTYGGNYFFTVFPSHKISNTVIEPYNTLLTLDRLAQAENVVCFDNESLYRICYDTLELESPTFSDLNRLISMTMAGNTASFRFPGSINADMNKLSYSLRCIPMLHYYIPSFAPLTSIKNQSYTNLDVRELVKQMTLEENMMVDSRCSPEDAKKAEEEETDYSGRCVSYAALFRGNMATSEVDEALTYLRGNQKMENNMRETIGCYPRMDLILDSVRGTQKYIERNPRPTFNTITNYAPPGMSMSCTYLRNTTSIKFKFLQIVHNAMRMYATKSYVQWFEKPKDISDKQDKNFKSLGEVILWASADFVSHIGVVDGTDFPQPIEEQEVIERITQRNDDDLADPTL